MSSLWVNNPRKKPDPPEMMDGTGKIASPASPPGGKRLDPPEMMNGCCRIPSPAQDTTVDHNLLVRRNKKWQLNVSAESNTVLLSRNRVDQTFQGPLVILCRREGPVTISMERGLNSREAQWHYQ
jgi:hypothetical protein